MMAIVTRLQQRSHLFHKLHSFTVSPVILCRYYQSFIERLLSFSFDSKRQKGPEQHC